jgi:tetratricopeptide (TPR) repeat protein
MRTRITLAALVVLMAGFRAAGDVVHLHDGTSITGEIKKAADGWYVKDPTGKVTKVSADVVRSIELSARGDPKDLAAGRLASLRRSVEALPDLKMVVDRYEKFIEQNKEAPPSVVEDAKKDLAGWRDRQEKGMVRVGNKWVLPEERAAMQIRALAVVEQARDLLKQNKLRDADATVTKALEVDPTNASALYLKGLILYRQDQIPGARKAFEQVKEGMPDHGPALNNLAVIMWRQNQQMAALSVYLQAMQAMPMNKELLNNVAEALNGLSEDQRKAQVAQKVYKLWVEQDTQLQQQYGPLGWYRWGSTWVDRAQYEKLQAAEKEVKDKIAKMETDFADAQGKVETIDAQIKQNRDAMRYMEQQRIAYDAQGKMTAYPLPPQYWDYDRANRRLQVQREEAVALLDTLRKKAQVVKGQLPTPKFTGVQLLIGVEGTPAIPPVAGAGNQAPGAGVATEEPKVANLTEAVGNATGEKPVEKPAVEKPKVPGAGERPLKY